MPPFRTALLPPTAVALVQALLDPRLERLARSLHLDLRDPDIRALLRERAKQYVAESLRWSAVQKRQPIRELDQGEEAYARAAIDSYREIAALI